MSSSLFRKEAVEHQKDRLMGEVILLQPLSLAVLTFVVIFITSSIIALLFWGTYARKETVRGLLEPNHGIVRIYPPSAGTATHVHVREGQEVHVGDPLITMQADRHMENGKDVDSLLLEEIKHELNQIDKRIADEKQLESQERVRLEKQIKGLEQEIEQIEESIALNEERLKLSEERVEAYQKLLDKNLGSKKDFDQVQGEHLSLKQQHQELLRNKTTRENTLIEAKAQLEALPLQVQAKVRSLEKERSDLRARQYEVEGRRIFEVRAPVDGTIDDLTAHEGQWLNPQAPNILAIIPKDSALRAELYVPTRAIGFIEVGQTVRIRYDAFPHQRYGIYEGEIESISAHILHPREIDAPLEIQEPVYRVVVVIKDQTISAYGKDMPLQAGMSLEADIIIERQSLLDWIFDPLYSLKGKL